MQEVRRLVRLLVHEACRGAFSRTCKRSGRIMTDPATIRVAAVLVPKELNVAVEQKTPGGLEVEEWQILRRVVDLIKANAPGGELGPTLQMIENALRADQAKMIEAQ